MNDYSVQSRPTAAMLNQNLCLLCFYPILRHNKNILSLFCIHFFTTPHQLYVHCILHIMHVCIPSWRKEIRKNSLFSLSYKSISNSCWYSELKRIALLLVLCSPREFYVCPYSLHQVISLHITFTSLSLQSLSTHKNTECSSCVFLWVWEKWKCFSSSLLVCCAFTIATTTTKLSRVKVTLFWV